MPEKDIEATEINTASSYTEPPLAGAPEVTPGPDLGPEAPAAPSQPIDNMGPKPGWLPLKPVAIMPILDIKNEIFTARLNYDWSYTEQERTDISELIDACGITAPAWAQLAGAILGRDAAKFAAYRVNRGRDDGTLTGDKIVGHKDPPGGR